MAAARQDRPARLSRGLWLYLVTRLHNRTRVRLEQERNEATEHILRALAPGVRFFDYEGRGAPTADRDAHSRRLGSARPSPQWRARPMTTDQGTPPHNPGSHPPHDDTARARYLRRLAGLMHARLRELQYDAEIDLMMQGHAGRVYGLLVSLGADDETAMSHTHDAFMITCRDWVKVRKFEQPAAYTCKVARILYRHRYKAHTRQQAALAHPHVFDESSSAHPIAPCRNDFTQAELWLDMRTALAALPEREREAVVLRHIYDLSEATTAAVMGIRVGSVKAYASRGRFRLQELLAIYGEGRKDKQ